MGGGGWGGGGSEGEWDSDESAAARRMCAAKGQARRQGEGNGGGERCSEHSGTADAPDGHVTSAGGSAAGSQRLASVLPNSSGKHFSVGLHL